MLNINNQSTSLSAVSSKDDMALAEFYTDINNGINGTVTCTINITKSNLNSANVTYILKDLAALYEEILELI